jgi:hypothetical protein
MGRSYPSVLLAAGFLLLIPLSANAWGKKDAPREEPKQNMTELKADEGLNPAGEAAENFPEGIMRVHGRIRLVGNMPFPRLVITGESDQDWYLEGADRELLAAYEQRLLTISGRAEYQDIILANGEKAGVRRFLRDIRIIETP